MKVIRIILFVVLNSVLFAQQQRITGRVISETNQKVIAGAIIQLNSDGKKYITDKNGNFEIPASFNQKVQLLVVHSDFQVQYKQIQASATDTIKVLIKLKQRITDLQAIDVYAKQKPETLCSSPKFSIYDFDFFEDKYILLTSTNELKTAELKLVSSSGSLISNYFIPKEAGEPKYFYKDFEGYTDLVCKDTVLRIDVLNNQLWPLTIPKNEFDNFYANVNDSINQFLLHHNWWSDYPVFSYFSLKNNDTLSNSFHTVCDADLLKLYNIEYRYLPTYAKLECRRIADKLKIDKYIVAALMSGFTKSYYYEPLYAPLFVLKDTIHIFNHYVNYLYHYSKDLVLLDSVKINYHHPKNWKEWKKQLLVDKQQNKVYAFFSRNGHHYIKGINSATGQELGSYQLQNHSAQKIKLKDGYLYYVYRPFDSTQEKFLYREQIRLE